MTDEKSPVKQKNVDSLLTFYAKSRGYFLSNPNLKTLEDLLKVAPKNYSAPKSPISSAPGQKSEKSAHWREFTEFCQFLAANQEILADLRPAIPKIFVAFLCDLKANGLIDDCKTSKTSIKLTKLIEIKHKIDSFGLN